MVQVHSGVDGAYAESLVNQGYPWRVYQGHYGSLSSQDALVSLSHLTGVLLALHRILAVG